VSYSSPTGSSEDLPIDLSFNPDTPDPFGRLPGEEKGHYVERAHQISSRAEMQTFLAELGTSYTL